MEQYSSNLAPEMYMYITKKTQMWCHSHGNSLGFSLFLWKTKYPHLQPFYNKWDRAPAQNTHGSDIAYTLLIRLLGVDDTWLRQKLGLSILISLDQ